MVDTRLFPAGLIDTDWVEFNASGFSEPVAGIIHRKNCPAICGMPLGGIDTGFANLETNGTLGFCTMFNSIVPRRGPMNLPFLGMTVGKKSWVLSTQDLLGEPESTFEYALPKAASVRDIDFWGHYPVADMEFDIADTPVSVGVRAWTPFLPGDVATSNTPGAVFEVRLRNLTGEAQKGNLVFSFPGPSAQESAGELTFEHKPIHDRFSGIEVSNKAGIGYALGVIGRDDIRTGGDLGVDGGAWSRISEGPWFSEHYTIWDTLPEAVGQAGSSVAVPFELPPDEVTTIRFVLAWHSPRWCAGGTPTRGGNVFTHMYASRYEGPVDTALFLADNHESLLARILAWQQVIYSDKDLPVWLRESLVNILHLITEDGLWGQALPPIGDWCKPEDGLFAFNETPRSCPQMECIPCSFYGNLPLTYFFPELAISTLRGYKAYQYPNGQAPWNFGGCTSEVKTPPCDLASPCPGYGHKPQATLDGLCYAEMVDKMWQCTGDDGILSEFYPSIKTNTIFTMNMKPEAGPAGIVSLPTDNNANDWYEYVELHGIVPHVGGIHLAQLRLAERMAVAVGDEEFAQQCREWFAQGSAVLEEETWNGEYYLLYTEPETGNESDMIMAHQLDGEWIAKFHGLEGVFPADRVATTLDTLERRCLCDRGAIGFTAIQEEDKSKTGYWGNSGIHIPGSITVGMTYMYHGRRDLGLEISHNTMKLLLIENRCSWDSTLLFRGDDGKRVYGSDYYQNMVLWSLPAAMAGDDIAEPCKSGGLIDRIVNAGKQNEYDMEGSRK